MNTRALVVAALLVATSSACGSVVYSRADLEESAAKHHIELRWGRLGSAVAHVHADLREPFLSSWERVAQQVELQELEVESIEVSPTDPDAAIVRVRIRWIDKNSMNLLSKTVAQSWARTDQGWMLTSPVNLIEAAER